MGHPHRVWNSLNVFYQCMSNNYYHHTTVCRIHRGSRIRQTTSWSSVNSTQPVQPTNPSNGKQRQTTWSLLGGVRHSWRTTGCAHHACSFPRERALTTIWSSCKPVFGVQSNQNKTTESVPIRVCFLFFGGLPGWTGICSQLIWFHRTGRVVLGAFCLFWKACVRCASHHQLLLCSATRHPFQVLAEFIEKSETERNQNLAVITHSYSRIRFLCGGAPWRWRSMVTVTHAVASCCRFEPVMWAVRSQTLLAV